MVAKLKKGTVEGMTHPAHDLHIEGLAQRDPAAAEQSNGVAGGRAREAAFLGDAAVTSTGAPEHCSGPVWLAEFSATVETSTAQT